MNKKFKTKDITQAIQITLLFGLVPSIVHAETMSDEETTLLPVMTLYAQNDETTEENDSYKAQSSRSSSKLKLDIKDTPQSVSVVTQEQMEQRNLTVIDDVLNATPGIFVTKLDSERSNYYARGYRIDNQQIDGLPSAKNTPRIDSFFFDRIEVVKGASGLTGATGDPSATINMIRKRPSKEFRGYAATSIGSWDTLRTEADVSIPLTSDGRVRSRVLAAYRDGESYMDYYSLESTAAMAIVEADLTEQLTGSMGVQYQDNNPKGSTWGAVPYWFSDGSLAQLPRNFSLANHWNTIQENDRTTFANLTYQFDNDWVLKAGATYSLSKSFLLISYTGNGLPNRDGTGMKMWSMVYPTSESKKTSLELYASGPFQLFDRQHDFIIGANGYSRSSNLPDGKLVGPAGDQLTCSKKENGRIVLSNDIGDNCVINDWQTWDGNATHKPDYIVIPAERDHTQRNYGIYSTLRLNLSDPLKLILGARQSYYIANNGDKSDIKTHAFTPYLGMTYALNDQYTAYASYTDMFNPSTEKDRNNNFLEPTLGKSYELGIKGSIFEDKLLATAAAFWSKKSNVAIPDYEAIHQGIKTNDGNDPMLASGQGININGFELEAIGQIIPDWNISAGYTYVNSVSSKDVTALTSVPQNQVKLYSSFHLPHTLWSGAEKLSIGLGVNWQSEMSKRVVGAPKNTDGLIRQDAYFLANAHLAYQFSDTCSANFQVSNLFDKEYYQNVGISNGVYWGEPRKVTLTLRVRF